ncbi:MULTISPECIES: CesT family type III secretion system chaperone [Brenneria]|uniref:CesT family type III secretion system chaperone n=1 Tax=Brenneria TaxID=71655 RepID=UPI0003068023|nr:MULTISPECIES: CesT family type III secretion system chaperone [Brenneria]
MAAMKGCWLALDENSTLRLCTQHAAETLDEPSFTALLPAFIRQAKETRLLIRGLFGSWRLNAVDPPQPVDPRQ